jgi:hypothetical protein
MKIFTHELSLNFRSFEEPFQRITKVIYGDKLKFRESGAHEIETTNQVFLASSNEAKLLDSPWINPY